MVVTVKFDGYTGPTLPDGTVPIPPICRTWSSSGMQCSRLQLPLRLAWAVTVHKAQGLTLDKVVIDIGKKEFSSGLTFVACSRVRCLDDILFNQTFTYERLTSLSKSRRLQERLVEDTRLRHSTIATLRSHGIIIDEPEVNIPPPSPNVCSPTSPSISPPTFHNVMHTSSLSIHSTGTFLPTASDDDISTPSPPYQDHVPSPPNDYNVYTPLNSPTSEELVGESITIN